MANEKGDGYTGGRLLNTTCILYSTIMIERIGRVFAIVILAYEILSNGLFWIIAHCPSHPRCGECFNSGIGSIHRESLSILTSNVAAPG